MNKKFGRNSGNKIAADAQIKVEAIKEQQCGNQLQTRAIEVQPSPNKNNLRICG